ncbi:MAG: toll/interleukin-1 receptor domain-containing protein, partial [Clostridia bacterium]|nr:toll/interleukin-1 receptor domain-containing protein [Clostridia bacterium]
ANDSRFFAIDHEYVITYAKSADNFQLNLDKGAEVTTSYNLEDENGKYALDRLDKQSIRYSDSLNYEIIGPDGVSYFPKHIDPNHPNENWRWGKDTVKERYNELVFKNGFVYTKNYQKDGATPRSLLVDERFGRTRTGKTLAFDIFGVSLFDNPKPMQLIKHLVEISSKEDPFDVFICYKESDDAGTRTKDSVLAQDLYYELIREGYKVFFSRITLEGKLGTEYEPYIFAALHSAKVMIVVGTSKMNLEATWVRNEWLRYLAIMKEDRNRKLIPAYQDMDPYDLPDALSMLQAQDMSKLGFMQDILDNVNRLVHGTEGALPAKRETLVVSDVTGTAPLLRRISYFLEDGEWDRAAQYCDRVLNLDPKCAQAYRYLVMVKHKFKTVEQFEKEGLNEAVMADNDFRKMIRFSDEATVARYNDLFYSKMYGESVERQSELEAIEVTDGAVRSEEWLALNKCFRNMEGYKDSKQRADHTKERAIERGIAELDADLHKLILPSEFRAFYEKRSEIENLLGKSRILEAFGSADPNVVYEKAKKAGNFKDSSKSLIEAARIFAILGNYKDSYEEMIECATLAIYNE